MQLDLDPWVEIVTAVLRVAPCVDKLNLSLRGLDVLGRRGYRTKCAVSRLSLQFDLDVAINARLARVAVHFIRNQVNGRPRL